MVDNINVKKTRIAKDGEPFDVDNIKIDTLSNQIEIIQYLRPNGIRRRMIADLDEKTAKKAQNLIISTELLPTNEVVFYIRRVGEPEEREHLEIFPNNTIDQDYGNNILRNIIEKYET